MSVKEKRAIYTEKILTLMDKELLKRLNKYLNGRNRNLFVRQAVEEKLDRQLIKLNNLLK